MASKVKKQRLDADWYQIAEEFLVTQESKPSLTIKEFCNMREDLKYNTVRVKLTPKIKELSAKREEQRLADQRKAKANSLKNTAGNAYESKVSQTRLNAEGKPPSKDAVNGSSHGIYGKYFAADILEQAARGELQDDLLLYRAKAISALDFIEKLQLDLDDAIEEQSECSKDDEERCQGRVEKLERRIITSDKALGWCITRIESLAMTIKKIELTAVVITKERANVIKTRAQTRMTLHQSNKFKADTKLARAKAYEIEHGNKGDDIYDIVKDLQAKRDLLPSFVKNNRG